MNGVSMVSWVLVSHRPLKADYYFRANGIKICIAIRYQNGILVSDIFKYSILTLDTATSVFSFLVQQIP